MSDQNEGWDTIEVPSKEEENKIEFEVEGEEEEEVLEAVEEKPFGYYHIIRQQSQNLCVSFYFLSHKFGYSFTA